MTWFLIGFVIITYLINKISLKYGFSNLDYKMEIDKRTYEIGEEIEVKSILENKKLLTISFLKVKEKFPHGFNKIENTYMIFIMPYQRVKRIYKIIPRKRGHYFIRDVILDLGDFVGLGTKTKYINLEKEIIIFPEKILLKEKLIPIGSLNGDTSVKRWIIEDPLMTIGIREYTGNEPERFIHWPSSAKYNKLMVKNFDYTTENTVIVVLNVETMKPSWKPIEEDMIERVISLARGTMEEFEKHKIPYGLATNAKFNDSDNKVNFYHPGLGYNHHSNFLEVLGKITHKLPYFFENTLREIGSRKGNYTTIVVITPRILDSYVDHINKLSKTVSRTVVISLEEEYLGDLNNNIIKYRSK